MMRSLTAMHQSVVEADDFEVGTIDSFLLNDKNWVLRYIVVDTHRWFSGKKVLLSPMAVKDYDDRNRTLSVYLSKEKVEKSPAIDTDKPISQRMEEIYAKHHNWPLYWKPPIAPPPGANPLDEEEWDMKGASDTHLRSSREITGYRVRAKGEAMGHVEDFMVEDENWIVRYLIIGIGEWEPEKLVLLSPAWIDGIDWGRRLVDLGIAREALEAAPAYERSKPVDREYEEELYEYFSKPKYWKDNGD